MPNKDKNITPKNNTNKISIRFFNDKEGLKTPGLLVFLQLKRLGYKVHVGNIYKFGNI